MGDKLEFEKNLYITYIDEVENYTFRNANFISIVSISMKKVDYINIIEKKWAELRKKYNVPTGVILHFTEIKALLNPKYFEKDIEKRNVDIEAIFCKDGVLDHENLYNFYIDAIQIIKECPLDIVVTGKRFEKNKILSDEIIKNLLHSNWYVLFKSHLDSLGDYMMNKSYNHFKETKRKKFKVLTTKLRVDGDYGLVSRGDFRDVFSEVICNGTTRYSRSFTRKCFDNLKFIDKSEVGNDYISHAGNEITDFVTLYVARGVYKDSMINDYIELKNVEMNEAEKYYKRSVNILVNSKNIRPFDEIRNKIYK